MRRLVVHNHFGPVRTSDNLDPRYLAWIAALKKANSAKNDYERARRTGNLAFPRLRAKWERLDAEQERLRKEGWQNESTSIIGGSRDASYSEKSGS